MGVKTRRAWKVGGHVTFGLGFVLVICSEVRWHLVGRSTTTAGLALMLLGAIPPNAALVMEAAAAERPSVKPLRARQRAGYAMCTLGLALALCGPLIADVAGRQMGLFSIVAGGTVAIFGAFFTAGAMLARAIAAQKEKLSGSQGDPARKGEA